MSRPDPAAVLVLRVWREGPKTVRARITETVDVTQPGQTTVVAGSVDDICGVVKDWMEDVVRGAETSRQARRAK